MNIFSVCIKFRTDISCYFTTHEFFIPHDRGRSTHKWNVPIWENISYEDFSHEISLLCVLGIHLEAVKSVPTGNGEVFKWGISCCSCSTKNALGCCNYHFIWCLHQTQIYTSLELLKEVGAWCFLDGGNNKEMTVVMKTVVFVWVC